MTRTRGAAVCDMMASGGVLMLRVRVGSAGSRRRLAGAVLAGGIQERGGLDEG
jgi:hypothetical protein